jgi:hypothetical protein
MSLVALDTVKYVTLHLKLQFLSAGSAVPRMFDDDSSDEEAEDLVTFVGCSMC